MLQQKDAQVLTLLCKASRKQDEQTGCIPTGTLPIKQQLLIGLQKGMQAWLVQ